MTPEPTPPRPDLSSPRRPTPAGKRPWILLVLVALVIVAAIPLSVRWLSGPLARVRTTVAICIATRSLLRQAEEAPSVNSGTPSDLGSLLPEGTSVTSTPYPDV